MANENMNDVMRKIYNEMVDIFQPVDLFHFGGDEVRRKEGRTKNNTKIVIFLKYKILNTNVNTSVNNALKSTRLV